ncbi:hypothetical protein Hdeb2414_s0020g00568441 [Helianthus debilis subsp. tardiflorus]
MPQLEYQLDRSKRGSRLLQYPAFRLQPPPLMTTRFIYSRHKAFFISALTRCQNRQVKSSQAGWVTGQNWVQVEIGMSIWDLIPVFFGVFGSVFSVRYRYFTKFYTSPGTVPYRTFSVPVPVEVPIYGEFPYRYRYRPHP